MSWIIKVFSGLHVGAESILKKTTVVGSGADCDVVLHDRGIPERFLEIKLSMGKAQVKSLVLQSVLHVDGVRCDGSSVTVKKYQWISCGVLFFSLGPAEEGWPQMDLLSAMQTKQQEAEVHIAQKDQELAQANQRAEQAEAEKMQLQQSMEQQSQAQSGDASDTDQEDVSPSTEEDGQAAAVDGVPDSAMVAGTQKKSRGRFSGYFVTSLILLLFVTVVIGSVIELTLDRNPVDGFFNGSSMEQETMSLREKIKGGEKVVSLVQGIADRNDIHAKIFLVPNAGGEDITISIDGYAITEKNRSDFLASLEKRKITADVSLVTVEVVKEGIESLLKQLLPDYQDITVHNVEGKPGEFILEGKTKYDRTWDQVLHTIRNDLPGVSKLIDSVAVADGLTVEEEIADAAQQSKPFQFKQSAEREAATEMTAEVVSTQDVRSPEAVVAYVDSFSNQENAELEGEGDEVYGPIIPNEVSKASEVREEVKSGFQMEENTTESIKEKKTDPDSFPLDISRVVLGSLHFFVTRDGKRYKVGDSLFNGYKVTGISSSGIEFSRGNSRAVYYLEAGSGKRVKIL